MTELLLHRPQLAAGVRLHWDAVRERQVLLFPEGALALNQTAVEVLELCDGERTREQISAALSERYDGADVSADVTELIAAIAERGLLVDADA